MSDFKANTHQIQFRLGHRPTPPGKGAYSAPPDPQLDLRGHYFYGLKMEGRERKGIRLNWVSIQFRQEKKISHKVR